jgi:hypothetical protein
MLAGVCIGFLPHNFYPARIFMGDTGSMLIGLMLAYAPISSLALLAPSSLTDPTAYQAGTVNRYGAFIPLLVPAAILLIPYADLLMAVVRRTRAGKSVFAPDKKHLQHRLLAIGHSHRTSVLIMYLWAALFSGTVILLSIVRTPLFVLAIVTVVAVLVLLLVTMPRLRPWSRATAGDRAADGQVPRHAGTAPAKAAPASTAPAATAPAATAPAVTAPAATAPAATAPARAPAGAPTAGVGTAGAATGAAATAGAVPAGSAAAGQKPARPAWSGVVKAPETARGNAARAAIRARLAESSTASGVAGNGDAPGKGVVGNGNGAAPAKDHGRQDPVGNGAAGPGTPATTTEGGTGSPVTHAAGHGGWSWGAGDTLPPHGDDQAVPPWAADDAEPAGCASIWGEGRDAAVPDEPRAVPPWAGESTVAAPESASPVPSWDAGTTAPPARADFLAAGRSLPPWELPPEARSAVPPWTAGHGIPPLADDGAPPSPAARSVPPWELADPDVTGPAPLPRPGQDGSAAVASQGPGNGPAAPPWPPAAPPRRPVTPPWPPTTPPWP